MLRRLSAKLMKSDTVSKQIVISITDIGVVGRMIEASGVEVYWLGCRRSLKSVSCLWRLYKIIRLFKPDVIQTWMYHADLLGGVIGRLAGCKNIIWNIRGTDVSIGSSKTTQKIQWLCAKLSNLLPKVIICAAHVSRDAHIKVGYSGDRMKVIPNGFELSELTTTPDRISALRMLLQMQIKNDDIVIGIVARFNLAKDHFNFIQASKIVAKKLPQAKFLLVGRGCDSKNEQLARWIEETGFSARFILFGETQDVASCLSMMHIFCLSSRTEGFPNVLGEAMALGKLCVATDVGDARLLLADCGIIVAKENPDALADGIIKLLSLSQEDKLQLSTRAINKISNEFSMNYAANEFLSVYQKISVGAYE